MCAEACLHHRWLRRKTPTPTPAPKPPPPVKQPELEVEVEVNNNSAAVEDKNKSSSSSSGKLDGTKDNLKTIVERWSEHPDSPYIFDTAAHTISPCPSLASVLANDSNLVTYDQASASRRESKK